MLLSKEKPFLDISALLFQARKSLPLHQLCSVPRSLRHDSRPVFRKNLSTSSFLGLKILLVYNDEGWVPKPAPKYVVRANDKEGM